MYVQNKAPYGLRPLRLLANMYKVTTLGYMPHHKGLACTRFQLTVAWRGKPDYLELDQEKLNEPISAVMLALWTINYT